MSTLVAGTLIVPGITGLVFLLLITHLQQQSRASQFKIWQLVWIFYLLHVALASLFYGPVPHWPVLAVARLGLVAMSLCLLISGRRLQRPGMAPLHWTELLAAVVGTAWVVLATVPTTAGFDKPPEIAPELGFAAVLLYAGWRFYRFGVRRDSLGYRVLTTSLGFWALLLATRQLGTVIPGIAEFAVSISPVPQVVLGLSMVMVIFEHERRMVQENALGLSILDVDTTRILDPQEMEPAFSRLLERVMPHAKAQRAFVYIAEPHQVQLPCVQRGLSQEFIEQVQRGRVFEPVCDLAFRRGGIATIRSLHNSDVPGLSSNATALLRKSLGQQGITSFTALALQGRDRLLGIVVFPHDENRTFGTAELRVLLALTMQIGTTLDNYLLMSEAHRRTREYEMLTQIGQVISSRLDPDEVLQAIHKELGRLFDTGTFYVAFISGDELRFEFETIQGVVQPKRSRKVSNGLAEHIIDNGEPLLIQSELKLKKAELGLRHEGRGAKSFVGVPIKMHGRTAGVICALDFEREFVYEERDLKLLQTAAGQLAVAMENALLYSEASRRAQYLSFLNNIANIAISNQATDDMLAAIVGEIQKNFDFEHIGIGILDYITKDIEIKAEAGKTARMLGRRIPVGVGIMGRVARSGETAVVQNSGEPHLLGLLPDARSVMCVPLKYGETLLGLLNVESKRENAFPPQDSLLLSTLADLLATALHNSLVFQKMEQQSITDGLTGIKTRRFFLEALQSEYKRAARSGRPFSIVLVDLDKFKEVNDSMGHLEGDLVLARVARILEQKCRQSNVVARYGGDEFIIMMPETGVEQSQILAERLRLWLATDPMLNERHVTGSFGVASFPLHGATVEEIIRVADAGMYVSKHAGGNRVSTAEIAKDREATNEHRQHIEQYVEGFLQRETITPDDVDELTTSLKRLTAELPQDQARDVLMDTMRTISHAAEVREVGGATHGEEVATYAEIIARRAGLSDGDIEQLKFAAQVHDIGKLVVSDKILNKPAKLAADDFRVVTEHAAVGARLISILPGVHRMHDWVRHHHERMNGSGYPDALTGEKIPLGARIIAVADAYVIMTTEQPFSMPKSPAEALRELEKSAHLYDPALVGLLAEHVRGERLTQSMADR